MIYLRGQHLASKKNKNINLPSQCIPYYFTTSSNFFSLLLWKCKVPADQLCIVLVKLSLGGKIANGIAWACYSSHFVRIYAFRGWNMLGQEWWNSQGMQPNPKRLLAFIQKITKEHEPTFHNVFNIINRSSVAGAVLQTAS